jgi:phytoene dehydrogenase-like protein
MQYDVILIGSGFGALTAAALLAKQGLKVCILEQTKYAGGCATTYKRKGHWFETGATTLVGLQENMPLHYLLAETGIKIPARKLKLPMQVHLSDGQVLSRYQSLEAWIKEAERVFGVYNQRPFWEHCYSVSQQVWATSLKQKNFPISSLHDVILSLKRASFSQLSLLPAAFNTMEDVLAKFDLLQHEVFLQFINEQLLITAQNTAAEVNELFGATALCYTLYNNYYVDGGLRNLIKPVVDYCLSRGGEIHYGQEVFQVSRISGGYKVVTPKRTFASRFVISGIPLNNTAEIFQDIKVKQRLKPYLLPSEKLNGAFTMGIVVKNLYKGRSLHHQVHVPDKIPIIGSKSIFVSFSHPEDNLRNTDGKTVVSISTHIAHPEAVRISDKRVIEQAILTILDKAGIVAKEDILYLSSATPGAWIFWTNRAYGAVGGYPQYKKVKPWQLKDARLDHAGAYVCGDTVYPGQGIVGVCLSGIIAVTKLRQDHKI